MTNTLCTKKGCPQGVLLFGDQSFWNESLFGRMRSRTGPSSILIGATREREGGKNLGRQWNRST